MGCVVSKDDIRLHDIEDRLDAIKQLDVDIKVLQRQIVMLQDSMNDNRRLSEEIHRVAVGLDN
ncbi:hypothetical protein TetV_637 [Tetraselmis virus 1]|uniref:Uncharacterized protein n=1 Tax=Tetraselmis virus 1 TaxID=2060617 RepID=A0A2P0VPE1_9VIRU|nr:hypothetical protein QJ968_gp417 [Tetraselmis virus 1]AUF82719.1 hypothetical protein TetV_637 [Tetraselmis virus 1]